MTKKLGQANSNIHDISVNIRFITKSDIPLIVAAFSKHNWPKPKSTFEEYIKEQQKGTRLVWVAYYKEQFAGYITLQWQSQYTSFQEAHIPEIVDLNVLPPFRNQGIGSRLLDVAEHEASKKSDVVGIGVGLYQDYGAAQRLYVKRGYVPNGQGVTYNYEPVAPGGAVKLDDNLVLWFTKTLKY